MTQLVGDFIHQAFSILQGVGPIELVDVVVVAFILYQLLRLVRGTQATQLIVGLVLLAVLGLIAVQLHLILLTWLVQNAASVIFIAIVVLFQPELRKVLDQIGRVGRHPLSSYTPLNRQLINRAISESIRAAERLSARKVGALVAFERDVGLEDYAETGVRLNSELSAELIQTIFFPNSPLHDGAVIVRGPTILAAGCLLPLPEEGTVRERLGTRHRAAIGLSLVSDALLVVVSEETGLISVVENGTITRGLDGDALRRRLTAGLEPARPSGGWRPFGNRIFKSSRSDNALARH
ncbi:MAG: diadenylate cyclase CdaA [Candidatus Dormiibacterota bacterium]